MKKRIYFILILSSCLIASLTASRTQAQAASLFADVPEGYWAYDYIVAIFEAGTIAGCSQSPLMYCPEDNVTREQMAVFITRAMNQVPADGYCGTTNPFFDVGFDRWSCKYIKRLVELGITAGVGQGWFGPEEPVTREQMAVFLTRALDQIPEDGYCGTTDPFTDVPYDRWSCKYVKKVSELVITTGYGDGRFGSDNYVTRAQMAVFLSRAFLGIYPNAPDFSQARSLPYETTDQVMFENVLIDSQHFSLIARWKNAKLEPIELRPLNTVEIPSTTATNGGPNWSGIAPVVTDPSGDMEDPSYTGVAGTDLANVYLAHDRTYLYGRMSMYNGGPLSDCFYAVELQQYLHQLHTPGDLIILVGSDAGGNWGISVQDRGPGHEVANYDETHVGVGYGWIEWKVPLVDLENPPDTPYPYFPAGPADRGIENRFIRAYIHPGPHPASPVADSNDPMTRPMIINFYQ